MQRNQIFVQNKIAFRVWQQPNRLPNFFKFRNNPELLYCATSMLQKLQKLLILQKQFQHDLMLDFLLQCYLLNLIHLNFLIRPNIIIRSDFRRLAISASFFVSKQLFLNFTLTLTSVAAAHSIQHVSRSVSCPVA